MPFGLAKFKQFAINVWGIAAEGKADEQIAGEGLTAMENWMKELGVAMNLTELGATADMIEGIADITLTMPGGYKVLEREDFYF